MFRGQLCWEPSRGIPIRIHFLADHFRAPELSLASGYFPQHYPDLPIPPYLDQSHHRGTVSFGSILVHELMHALMEQKLRCSIAGITYLPGGAVSEMKQEPPSLAPNSDRQCGPLAALYWPDFSGWYGEPGGEGGAQTLRSQRWHDTSPVSTRWWLSSTCYRLPPDGGRVLRSSFGGSQESKDRPLPGDPCSMSSLYTHRCLAVSYCGCGFPGDLMALIRFFPPPGCPGELTQVMLKRALAGICSRHDGEGRGTGQLNLGAET